MKGLIILVAAFTVGVVSEAPYPASGWRPSGPAFELPERNPVDPRSRTPQKQEYLPQSPGQAYGPPEVDVSVQGLPTDEQLPIFQLSPVNGQQYVGPNFNTDLRNLEQQQRQAQLQAQENINREFLRQRQLEAALASTNANRFANQPVPRQFVPRTTTTTTTPKPDDFRTTQSESTTEALTLNQGETVDDKDKVTVEVSKQNVQEYPPELFLASLAQLRLQNQFSPVQLGQLRAPIFLEPAQNQAYRTPAQFNNAVLNEQQLIQQYQLAQQQSLQTQLQLLQAQQQLANAQTPIVSGQPQLVTPQVQAQNPAFLAPQDQLAQQPELQLQYQPVNQYETVQQVQGYAQPTQGYAQPAQGYAQPAQGYAQPTQGYAQPTQGFAQTAQPAFLQPQQNQLLPRPQDAQQDQPQPQYVYQYQPEYQQPLSQFYQQPLNSYQPQLFVQDPSLQQQQQSGQGSLQSGLNINQQGNGIDGKRQDENEDDSDDNGATATAVATAFGTRTQPRVYNTYGAPVPVPRVQANPGYQTTTETQAENVTEGSGAAEATAVARGERRKSAKLRSRSGRVRPVFTLDNNGHLVLAEQQ